MLADDTAAALGGPIRTVQLGFGASELKLEIVYSSDLVGSVRLRVLLDKDENTLTGWERSIDFDLPGTEGKAIRTIVVISPMVAGARPWLYHVGALIGSGIVEREMYTSEQLFVVPELRLEWWFDSASPQGRVLQVVGVLNLKVNIEASADLVTWTDVEQLTLSTATENPITGSAKISKIDFEAGPNLYLRAKKL